MSEVEKNWDFIQWLGLDLSIKILTDLDDPCDLVRVSSVSSAWHQFVIENGMCKKLCLKKFPELSGVAHVIEVDNVIEPVRYMLGNSMNWECLKRNHKVYAFLARGLTPFVKNNCISETISASSTDNYPQESIQNTLEPRDNADFRASYWSSKGESDPSVPEKLIYKLTSKICVVTEIHVRPFQAYFQQGFPIYSAKAVRFRMGHPRYPKELKSTVAYKSIAKHILQGKEFVWTYTSPEFPMAQENRLQKFELPKPVLCVGGVLLVELLGRVQKQQIDELYYICVTHVQVVGRPLSPEFSVKVHHPSGKCTLKYHPRTDCCMFSTSTSSSSSSASSSNGDLSSPSRFRTFTSNIMQRGVRRWEQMILSALLGSGAVMVDD